MLESFKHESRRLLKPAEEYESLDQSTDQTGPEVEDEAEGQSKSSSIMSWRMVMFIFLISLSLFLWPYQKRKINRRYDIDSINAELEYHYSPAAIRQDLELMKIKMARVKSEVDEFKRRVEMSCRKPFI